MTRWAGYDIESQAGGSLTLAGRSQGEQGWPDSLIWDPPTLTLIEDRSIFNSTHYSDPNPKNPGSSNTSLTRSPNLPATRTAGPLVVAGPVQDDTDEKLVARSQAGDFQAFARLVSRYEKRVYNLAVRMLGDPDEAKDVLQEAFLNALTNINTLRRAASFATWVFRIAANSSLMRLRQKKGHRVDSLDEPLTAGDEDFPREPEDWSLNPAELYENTELRDALDKAIMELPEAYRVVLLLRDVEGFTSKQVGEVLNLSLPAVKSRLLRARLALRRKLRAFATTSDKS